MPKNKRFQRWFFVKFSGGIAPTPPYWVGAMRPSPDPNPSALRRFAPRSGPSVPPPWAPLFTFLNTPLRIPIYLVIRSRLEGSTFRTIAIYVFGYGFPYGFPYCRHSKPVKAHIPLRRLSRNFPGRKFRPGCPDNFVMISLTVQELSCWQTGKQTNKRALLKTVKS